MGIAGWERVRRKRSGRALPSRRGVGTRAAEAVKRRALAPQACYITHRKSAYFLIARGPTNIEGEVKKRGHFFLADSTLSSP